MSAEPVYLSTATALSLIKARLNRLDDLLDDYFTHRIEAAAQELAATGITLRDNQADLMLLVDFTVWRYQNRDTPGAMPDWLRQSRRERWLHERRSAEEAQAVEDAQTAEEAQEDDP